MDNVEPPVPSVCGLRAEPKTLCDASGEEASCDLRPQGGKRSRARKLCRPASFYAFFSWNARGCRLPGSAKKAGESEGGQPESTRGGDRTAPSRPTFLPCVKARKARRDACGYAVAHYGRKRYPSAQGFSEPDRRDVASQPCVVAAPWQAANSGSPVDSVFSTSSLSPCPGPSSELSSTSASFSSLSSSSPYVSHFGSLLSSFSTLPRASASPAYATSPASSSGSFSCSPQSTSEGSPFDTLGELSFVSSSRGTRPSSELGRRRRGAPHSAPRGQAACTAPAAPPLRSSRSFSSPFPPCASVREDVVRRPHACPRPRPRPAGRSQDSTAFQTSVQAHTREGARGAEVVRGDLAAAPVRATDGGCQAAGRRGARVSPRLRRHSAPSAGRSESAGAPRRSPAVSVFPGCAFPAEAEPGGLLTGGAGAWRLVARRRLHRSCGSRAPVQPRANSESVRVLGETPQRNWGIPDCPYHCSASTLHSAPASHSCSPRRLASVSPRPSTQSGALSALSRPPSSVSLRTRSCSRESRCPPPAALPPRRRTRPARCGSELQAGSVSPLFTSLAVHATDMHRSSSSEDGAGDLRRAFQRARAGRSASALIIRNDRVPYSASTSLDQRNARHNNGITSLWLPAAGRSELSAADFGEPQVRVTPPSAHSEQEAPGGCAVLGSRYPGFYEDDEDDDVMFVPRPDAVFLASRDSEVARGQALLLHQELGFRLDDSPRRLVPKPKAKEKPSMSGKLKSFFNFSIKGGSDRAGLRARKGTSDTLGSLSSGVYSSSAVDDGHVSTEGSHSYMRRDSDEDGLGLAMGLSMQSCISISDDDDDGSEPTTRDADNALSLRDARSLRGDNKQLLGDSVSSTRSSLRIGRVDTTDGEAARTPTSEASRGSPRRRPVKTETKREDDEGDCLCCCCCCCEPDAEEGRETIKVERKGRRGDESRRSLRRHRSRRKTGSSSSGLRTREKSSTSTKR
ncbi:hypothetical protein BESB_038630 [Besnoitia besnoiti]|uniref:Uncharacterized protein n=1 Tax=Besnoitia besnoiti TaxID=94643 RepID=A0A2A9MHG3_BESBE|nr:hypothetical protein BESB_038630 [Besnoitia besnoiti]PFH37405.1 hypothetical protein BESB_038630 [Besnoitia besnoiti]